MAHTRRIFLAWSAGGALCLALAARAGSAAGDDIADPEGLTPWIAISPDGKVRLFSTASEMGQGSMTGQAQILADELDAPWEAVEVVMAPDADPFRLFGRLGTGGSSSIRTRFHILRQAGATARAMLIAEAAKRWGVAASECSASLGEVVHQPSGRREAYGALAAAAAAAPPPTDPSLKDPSQWRYIGKPIPPIQEEARTRGEARYGIDVRIRGMAVATIRQCPTYGGSLQSVNEGPARAVPGFIAVVKLDNAVAVVAKDTWTAFKASEALSPIWRLPTDRLNSSDLSARLLSALDGPDAQITSTADDAAAERAALRAAYAASPRRLEATYEVPYLAHAPLEPMNAAARVSAEKIEIWAPTQNLTSLRNEVGRALGRSPHEVELTVTLLGGGFGRRLKVDYAVQAAQIAAGCGHPVRLVWRREEDFSHDFYRPASLNRYRAVLGEDGLIDGYEITGSTTNDAAEGGADPAPYSLKRFANTQSELKTGVPVGAWRSVDNSITTFGRESFIDEAAHAAGRDPLTYRLALLDRHPRARRVLTAAADAIEFKRARNAGAGVGLALFQGWETILAHAVEVEVKGNALKVRRIVVAGDPGTVVNPDQVRAQWQGGAVMALSAACGEAMTFEDGKAAKTNFDRYPLLRMRSCPEVEVILLETSKAAVGGAGEPPVPGLAPALANAIFAACGRRIRTLPFSAAGLSV
ncbi:MAG: molybdopterin cofactor-binding domain-containing protein [Caulobacteraceae bacterium]